MGGAPVFTARRAWPFGPCSLDIFKTSTGSINRFFLRKLRETQDRGLRRRPERVPAGRRNTAARSIPKISFFKADTVFL
jgi:hypothetical protein